MIGEFTLAGRRGGVAFVAASEVAAIVRADTSPSYQPVTTLVLKSGEKIEVAGSARDTAKKVGWT